MSAFEDFVNLELPRRPTMLTTALTGYDGDPNLASQPVINNAPRGTFFLQLTGNVLWKKNAQTPSNTWEVVGGGGSSIPVFAKLFTRLAPVWADPAFVLASFLANAANSSPGPFVNPDAPRNLRVTMSTGWDGGDVTVNGTDQFDAVISEVFLTGSNVVRVGEKIFKTVTAVSKSLTGATANGATVGLGNKLGVVGRLADTISALSFVDNVAEQATLDIVNHGYTPTTAPDGVLNYTLLANVTE